MDFRVLDAQDESHHRGQVEERVSHERVPRELHHLATDIQVSVVKSPAATPSLIKPDIYHKNVHVWSQAKTRSFQAQEAFRSLLHSLTFYIVS